jgi:hypothetical protein
MEPWQYRCTGSFNRENARSDVPASRRYSFSVEIKREKERAGGMVTS